MELDRQGLRELAQLRDDIGVLSIYASLDAHMHDGGQPIAWAHVRADLEALLEEVRRDAPRGHSRALADRVDALAFDLENLLTTAGGVGRALVAPVSREDLHTVSLQRPLVNRVVFKPTTYVRPLVAAWSLDGPAGVAVVSADGVRLVDLRFGNASDAITFAFPEEPERRELRNPAAANPSRPLESVKLTDLYERRHRDHVIRFLSTIAAKVPDVATSREWGYLAVSGDGELVAAFVSGLPTVWPVTVVRLPHVLSAAPPREVAEAVRADLDRARKEGARRMAELVRDAALSGGVGALGLGETLGVLQEGRVAHLLLDDTRSWQGSRTPEGDLVSEGETPPWVDRDKLAPEPYLGERMIEIALGTGAEVMLLDPVAAEPLADSDGVGALLRW